MHKVIKKGYVPSYPVNMVKAASGGGGGGGGIVYQASPSLNQTDPGNASTTFRMKLPVTGVSGLTQIRATIKPGLSGGDLTILGLAIGKWDSGTNINTAAPMVEGKFGGVTGFTAQTTEQTSDWASAAGMGLVDGDYVVIGLTTGLANSCTLAFDDAQPAGVESWWQTNTSWNTQDVSAMGFSLLANYNFAVVSVEMQ